MQNITVKNSSDYKYNPNMFNSPLKEYMINAYNALDNNDNFHYRLACADIHQELKLLWIDGIIGKKKANEMQDYFWGMAE